MNRFFWRLASLLSQTLGASEREAVFGDLAESGESGPQALADVTGLVIRQQAELWSDHRLWIVLAGGILPLGILLAIVAQSAITQSSVYAWLYLNNWDSALLQQRGFWYALGGSVQYLFGAYTLLVCYSWSTGFLLGRISRRLSFRLSAFLFSFALLFGILFGAPRYLSFFSQQIQQALALPAMARASDPVSSLWFYRAIFPALVIAIAVGIPAIWGMHHEQNVARFRLKVRRLIWAAILVTVIGLLIHQPGFVFVLLLKAGVRPETWPEWSRSVRLTMQASQVFAYWPLAYLFLRAFQHWREQTTPCVGSPISQRNSL